MQTRWKPSVTVAAVIERDGRFLLVEEETSEGLRLNNPAGHLEPCESPQQACAREVLEETAHAFRPTALVGVYLARFQRHAGDDITYLRMTFCGQLGERDPLRRLDRRHRHRRVADAAGSACQRPPPPQSLGAALHGGLPRRRAPPAGGAPHRRERLAPLSEGRRSKALAHPRRGATPGSG